MREKIAILGGGIGSLTAAYELAIQKKYDITVYQMGWRLGGQGASGRNMALNDRIEEHGLHIWFGFYKNAFNLMWRCYEALDRRNGAPLASVQAAFTGEDQFCLLENIGGEFRNWNFVMAHTDDFPGIPPNDKELPTVWETILFLLDALREHFRKNVLPHVAHTPACTEQPSWLGGIVNTIEDTLKVGILCADALLLEGACRLAASLDKDTQNHSDHDHQKLHFLVTSFRTWVNSGISALTKGNDDLRRDLILLDLGLTCVAGMIADGVPKNGLNILNGLEFRQWLAKHNARTETVRCAVVQALYDAAFAYDNGSPESPNMAAGVALRASLRIIFTYTGHVFWKMNAGMGDAIFAPLFLLLQNLGVKFEFFHRVLSLEPDLTENKIRRIHIARQVTLKDPEYKPLYEVKGLPCWPNKPLASQIIENIDGIDLESRWSGWRDVKTFALEAGVDYDKIILGISIGGLPEICSGLIEINPKWKRMIDSLKTVQTQQVQIWMKPALSETGWKAPGGITACCIEPDASWGDFSQVLPRENTPAAVGSLYYGCGPLPDDERRMPPPEDHDFPEREKQRAKQTAMSILRNQATLLFPSITSPEGHVDWNALAAPDPLTGEQRFDAQYWRANVDPCERYVLSVAGGEDARLKADESGFSNLYLTGTWIDNGLNISSVEAGVMSGMQASRAISGSPTIIIGEKDL